MKIKQISAAETWALRHEVMWPKMDLNFVKLPRDEAGTHFGGYIDQTLVSVVSLFKTDAGVMQFRKLATKTTEQSKGYGSKMLSHLTAYAKKQEAHTLWCNARSDKIEFYKKFGFKLTAETFVKEGLNFVVLIHKI